MPGRLFLAASALLFVGWLAWLAVAVNGKHDAAVISRAQLIAAHAAVAADVSADASGLPAAKVANTQVVWQNPAFPALSAVESVPNLPEAQVPTGGFPGPGRYLLLLTPAGIAGLPRSPGYGEANPARPVIYPWDEKAERQLGGIVEK